jgi:hypothetical protein
MPSTSLVITRRCSAADLAGFGPSKPLARSAQLFNIATLLRGSGRDGVPGSAHVITARVIKQMTGLQRMR